MPWLVSFYLRRLSRAFLFVTKNQYIRMMLSLCLPPSANPSPPFPLSFAPDLDMGGGESYSSSICVYTSNWMNACRDTNAWAHVLVLDLTISCVHIHTFFEWNSMTAIKAGTALYGNEERERERKEKAISFERAIGYFLYYCDVSDIDRVC